MSATIPIEDARWRSRKFHVRINGKRVVAYFVDMFPPSTVLKVDGRHTYYWYKDSRVEQTVTLL